MGNSLQILHLIHSLDPSTGGVLSAVELLNQALLDVGVDSRVSDDPVAKTKKNQDEWIIAHGLWQWPGRRAQETGNRYLVYPHGMLDPWFKKSQPAKTFKKTIILVGKTGQYNAELSCRLFYHRGGAYARPKTFFPYKAKVVTGLGVTEPPVQTDADTEKFHQKFPYLKDQKYLLYLGRFHLRRASTIL